MRRTVHKNVKNYTAENLSRFQETSVCYMGNKKPNELEPHLILSGSLKFFCCCIYQTECYW